MPAPTMSDVPPEPCRMKMASLRPVSVCTRSKYVSLLLDPLLKGAGEGVGAIGAGGGMFSSLSEDS